MSILFVCAAPAESWLFCWTKARMEFLCPSCSPYHCISSQYRVQFIKGNKHFFLCASQIAKRHFHIVVVQGRRYFKLFPRAVELAVIDLEEWWTVRDSRTDRTNRAASWRTHYCSQLWWKWDMSRTFSDQVDASLGGMLKNSRGCLTVIQFYHFFLQSFCPSGNFLLEAKCLRNTILVLIGTPMPTPGTEVSDSWLVDYWIASSFGGSLAADANF